MMVQMERANEFEAKSMMKDTKIVELERSLKAFQFVDIEKYRLMASEIKIQQNTIDINEKENLKF